MQTPLQLAPLELVPDPATDPRLLPTALTWRDNSRRIRHYKIALAQAMAGCLTPEQRRQIELFYHQGLRKSQIADLQQCSCSAVSKSIKRGLAALHSYIEQYMCIYDSVEQEFLGNENEYET